MEIKLSLCHCCDRFEMERLEKLFSLAQSIGKISTCPLCNKANNRLIFFITIPATYELHEDGI